MPTLEGYRLSLQQRDLWSLAHENPAFRSQCLLLLDGELRPPAVKHAVERVVEQHAILRTTFRRLPGMRTPVQIPEQPGRPEWAERDLGGLTADERAAALSALYADERRRRFDYAAGPALRATLVALAPRAHALLLAAPALCVDGRSLGNLVAAIGRHYAAALRGQELAEEVVQYLQYAEWQNEAAVPQDGVVAAQPNGRGTAPPPAIMFERRHGVREPCAPEELVVPLADELLAAAEEVARSQGASLPLFLHACWRVLVQRLAARPVPTIGLIRHERPIPELDEAIGPFAERRPVACDFDGGTAFSELLARLGDAVRETGDRPAEAGGGGADRSVDFEFDEWPLEPLAGGVAVGLQQRFSCTHPFRLKLSCARAAGRLRVAVEHDARSIGRDDAERIAHAFGTLLASAVRTPAVPVGDLEILDAAERHAVVVGFNQTAAPYPSDRRVHELFEEWARRSPESPAVVVGERRLAYGELNARANRLARFLRRRGVGPAALVGLCVDRSPDMVVGLLGILKAGGAYVALDPENPAARLAQQLSDSRPALLVTQARHLTKLTPPDASVVCLDRDEHLLAGEPVDDPPATGTPDDLAYVLYTSGSTGVPKGVCVRHRGLTNYAHHIVRMLGLGARASFATVSTIGADLGNTAIFPALISGGCLHVVTYEAATDGDSFASYLARHRIDVLKIVPSHLNALTTVYAGAELLPRRYLVLGGEPLSPELVERVFARSTELEIVNHYGPTETTVGSLTFRLRPDRRPDGGCATVPIGRPIANTEAYILDERGQPVPIGVPGELYIGGVGLARCYLHRPDETSQRFVPHPFADGPGARLYRTGDLARRLPDGAIEFLGRNDDQVKLRGFRVELGEVEAALARHPALRQVVVAAPADAATGERRLVAYVVRSPGNSIVAAELRAHLREALPDYMVPSAFVQLDSLPLTRNGKVDRAALPDPAAVPPPADERYTAPRTELERAIAAVWQEALRVPRVGVNDNFFDLGGHSLLMVQVHSKLRATLPQELSIVELFKYPTVGALARALADAAGVPDAGERGRARGQARRAAARERSRPRRAAARSSPE